jgi:hypothetical protein
MGYQFKSGENHVDYINEMYIKYFFQTHELLYYSILESYV